MIQRKEVQKQPQAQPEERLPHKTAQDGVQRCPVTLRIWPNSFVAGTSNPHRASSSGRSPWSTSTQALTKSPTNSICSFFEHGAPRTSALSSKFLQPIGPNGDMVVSIGLVRRFCWIFGPYKRNLVPAQIPHVNIDLAVSRILSISLSSGPRYPVIFVEPPGFLPLPGVWRSLELSVL